jgi:hypothetical protein
MSEDSLDVVFYSSPVPRSLRTLAILALVFDKVHFPGVYIPEQIDDKETARQVAKWSSDASTLRSIRPEAYNCIVYALHRKFLGDFCLFGGKVGYAGTLEPDAEQLVRSFEEAIYGPPPENFFPAYDMGFAMAVPGSGSASVNGPSWLSYPPNALLFASRRGLVIVNDDPSLPVLGVPASFKADARGLATTLALEAVSLTLPALPKLTFEQIAELRSETRDDTKTFRRAMLRLSRDLNAALLSNASLQDVQREARFLVETSVLPELAEIRESLAKPSKPWYRRATDLATSVPELVGNFATLPTSMATARLLAALANLLADVRDGQLEASGVAKRGGLHFLIRVQDSEK